MGLLNKITKAEYDTTFSVSDDANVYENYNYSNANVDSVLQSVYRYFQDHERRRNLNCIYRGFSASINGTDIEIAKAGTEDAEAIVAGRIAVMDDNPRVFDIAETTPTWEVFTADDTNFIYIEHSTITESTTRDGSSGETFTWKITTDISAFDDHQLVICSVDVNVGKTAFSNLVQLANPYEVEANKFRPKYDHSMGFYVGDGHIQSRSLSVLMDWDYTTFYLPIKVDTIDEETTDAGVTIEGVLIKDSIIDTSASFTVDTITEHTTDAGVTVESVAMEDGDIDSAGGLTIDTIDEHTIAAGVTVEGMLIKDITTIKADTNIFYVNTIDDYSGGILTITPNVDISGTLDVTGDVDINSVLTVAAVTGNTLISGTLGVTGLVTSSVAGFSGALTGDVTGKATSADKWATGRTLTLSGDVTGTSSVWDGSGNATLTATVVNDLHNHTLSSLTLSGGQTNITQVGTITAGVWGSLATPIANTSIAGIDQNLLQASTPTFAQVTATTFHGALNGAATSAGNADTLTTGGTIALSGDVTATGVLFDGSQNITISGTVVGDNTHNHSTSTITDINQPLLLTSSPTFADLTISDGVWRGVSFYGSGYRNVASLGYASTDNYLSTTITVGEAYGYCYPEINTKSTSIQVKGVVYGLADGSNAGLNIQFVLEKRTTSGSWASICSDSDGDSCTPNGGPCTFGPTAITLSASIPAQTIDGDEGYRLKLRVYKIGTGNLSSTYARIYGVAIKEWT